jgi:DNA-binding response OmpR family regulator
MRVLLVDDEEELVVTLAERLAIRGIDADWVTSGEDALSKAETQHYDLSVLDVKIPRISGINLKKELEKKNPHMKFIFMTGHGSEDDYIAGTEEAGSEFYLVKPVDIRTLIEKMNTALNSAGGSI